MEEQKNTSKGLEILISIKNYIKEFFDLRKSKENEELTVESIRHGVVFKGTNLWVLIFAIFIASLGLNVNSTAVIIGAMLISPLMGPIMGFGLAVGISDFELLKQSFKSYLLTTFISVVTSTLYFSLTPLNEVQSELLARTSPTIYDVLIALFGGLAGIIAVSTKEKGNVIPGAAIATALMPPLCTAGFGLATGNIFYFLGAFYLYFINSVFISFATYLGVRFMHFKRKDFVDKQREQMVRRYIIALVLVTMCPAFYLTYGIVKTTFYEASANSFIAKEFDFEHTQVISRKISYDEKEIRVVLVGNELTQPELDKVHNSLKHYNLEDTQLTIVQGMNSDNLDMGMLKAQVMEDFYKDSEERLQEQQEEILRLRNELRNYTTYHQLNKQIVPELKVLYPQVERISMSQMIVFTTDSMHADTLTMVLMGLKSEMEANQMEQFKQWLKTRVGTNKMKFVVE
ncbi:MAG: TIGR00341 family protein [Bacteroidaceae bacterium]|nr:TIGR00341 family protein [Bacteroidaceae bacterium]